MPYVEGFDTWPFGEEWLWEATASVYLPLLERLEARRGAAHGGGHAGAGRPAGGHARRRRRRSLPPLPARGPQRGARRSTSAGCARRASSDLADEVRRAAGDYERAGRGVRGARPRPDQRVRRRWASSCGRPRPPTRCCRWWPPSPAWRSSWPPARARTSAGSATSTAASGCPNARTCPAWSASWPTTASSVFCVDQPGASLAAGGHRGGAGGRPHRLGDDLAGLERPVRIPGPSALPRLPPPDHPRPASVEQRRQSRTTRRLLAPRRTSTRATSWTASRARVAWSAARWTPSCSGTGGTRAWSGCRPSWRRPRGAGWSWSRSARASSAWGRCRASCGSRAGAPPRTSPPGTRRRWPSWSSAARRAELDLLAAAPHEGLPRGLRELLALQSSDWAFLVTRDLAADYPLRRRGRPRGRCPGRSGTLPLGSGPPQPRAGPRSRLVLRTLILSWEYPPLIEGGLARHVRKLAEGLVAEGVEVHVITRGHEESPPEEEMGGVLVHRVREPERPRDLGEFVTWIEHMNADMLAAGRGAGRPDHLRPGPRPRLAGGQRLRPPGQALPVPLRRHHPRHRVRPPPGLGGQAPAVLHPRGRALDGQPRRAGDRLLGLHARARGRHLRPGGGAHLGHPQRDRPQGAGPGRRPRLAARPLRRARRAARAAGGPARLREGLPAGAGGDARAWSSGWATCASWWRARAPPRPTCAGRPPSWGSTPTAPSWAGSATTSCTRSTASPT